MHLNQLLVQMENITSQKAQCSQVVTVLTCLPTLAMSLTQLQCLEDPLGFWACGHYGGWYTHRVAKNSGEPEPAYCMYPLSLHACYMVLLDFTVETQTQRQNH